MGILKDYTSFMVEFLPTNNTLSNYFINVTQESQISIFGDNIIIGSLKSITFFWCGICLSKRSLIEF